MMKRSVFLMLMLWFLPIIGCGMQPIAVPRSCPDGQACLETVPAASTDDHVTDVAAPFEPVESVVSIAPLIPIGDTVDSPEPPEIQTLPFIPPELPALDPLALSIFTTADVPELLTGLLDGLILDLFVPTPGIGNLPGLLSPTPRTGSFTYLELQCIRQGQPEFLCRNRYGR